MKNSQLRRGLLRLTAIVFTGIAIGSLIKPHVMAEGLGYSLDNVDALNEFRAIYVGLWLATAVLLVIAANRVQEAILGDFCAILVLGQVAGRAVSVLLDALPSERVLTMLALEAIGGLALLLVRPSDGTKAT